MTQTSKTQTPPPSLAGLGLKKPQIFDLDQSGQKWSQLIGFGEKSDFGAKKNYVCGDIGANRGARRTT